MIDPEFQRLSTLFLQLRRCGPEERNRRLEELAATDDRCAAELRRLLAADASEETPVDRATDRLSAQRAAIEAAGMRRGPAPGAPTVVGGYRLIRLIGRGTHGDVWLGEQETPIRRLAAVKILRAVVPSDATDRRFRRELRATESLDHPGIARLLDAGVSADVGPYLIFEHIPGLPVTEFAERESLGLAARLRLVITMAQAIGFAHRHGVLHRDLKPTNILAFRDEDGAADRVKVIDFGIAQVLSDDANTRTERFAGSRGYASPEQVGLSGGFPDTRSDIYALGVILHELLTGSRPAEAANEQRPTPAIREFWRAESSRASSELLPSLVVDRSRIRDELDWIAARCLRVEPDERYQTADALADDLGRFLRREAVVARPPTLLYTARKVVRRRPAAAAAGLTTCAAILAITITISVALAQVEAQRARTAAARAQEADARRRAEAVAGFVIGRLDQRNPANHGVDTTVLEAFDAAYEEIESRFADDPGVAAELHRVAGDALSTYGNAGDALRHYRRRVELVEQLHGIESEEGVSALSGVAVTLLALGRAEESQEVDRRALDIAERALPPDHPSSLIAEERWATHLVRQGRLEEAVELQESVVERFEQTAPGTIDAEKARISLGILLRTADRPDEARTRLAAGVERLSRLVPNHPSRLEGLNALGAVLTDLGDLAEAERVYEELLPVVDRHYAAASAPAIVTRANLASVLERAARIDAAIEVYAEIERLVDEAFEPSNPMRRTLLARHARLLALAGRRDEASARLDALVGRAAGREEAIPPQVAQIVAETRVLLEEEER